jgi:toxin ParE1/3/4
VSEYRLSSQAELDIADIADYTTDIWGQTQAEVYLSSLTACFARIAMSPGLGRRCDSVHPGFRRVEEGKHIIFYKPAKGGVFISRILHQSMLPKRHEILSDGS